MKRDEKRSAVCPLCGKVYHGYPALSREDGKTLLCADCGVRQSLIAIGIADDEIEEIIRIIHRYTDGRES